MRALIRHPGETVTEDTGIDGIDWGTGSPLTSPYWHGGSYTLVEDYVPSAEPTVEPVVDVSEPVVESTHSLTDDEILTLLKAIKK